MPRSHKLGAMPQILLSPRMVEQIAELGYLRAPREACGVLLPTPDAQGKQVIELPNRSMNEAEYTMWSQDILLAIEGWAYSVSDKERNAVAVWHTHPAGNIGPSPGDMEKRIEGAAYLVVALKNGAGIPAWF